MKNIFWILLALTLFLVVFYIAKKINPPAQNFAPPEDTASENIPETVRTVPDAPVPFPADGLAEPLPNTAERVTKKPFGQYVEPGNSPVSPERFTGFHTAIDLEAFPEEIGRDTSVKAVCDGELASKRNAQGYGGVIVQNCTLDEKPITVVYGHLDLASITASPGETLRAGETLGILGEHMSPETDGERKHLHLGFHKGSTVNILGYVQSQSELQNWLDPCFYVCR